MEIESLEKEREKTSDRLESDFAAIDIQWGLLISVPKPLSFYVDLAGLFTEKKVLLYQQNHLLK